MSEKAKSNKFIIAVEGIDGVGKDTFIRNLKSLLDSPLCQVKVIDMLEKNPVYPQLREYLLRNPNLNAIQRALLYRVSAINAERHILADETDAWSQEGLTIYLMNRSVMSYNVYNGLMGIGTNNIEQLYKVTGQPLKADLTFTLMPQTREEVLNSEVVKDEAIAHILKSIHHRGTPDIVEEENFGNHLARAHFFKNQSVQSDIYGEVVRIPVLKADGLGRYSWRETYKIVAEAIGTLLILSENLEDSILEKALSNAERKIGPLNNFIKEFDHLSKEIDIDFLGEIVGSFRKG